MHGLKSSPKEKKLGVKISNQQSKIRITSQKLMKFTVQIISGVFL